MGKPVPNYFVLMGSFKQAQLAVWIRQSIGKCVNSNSSNAIIKAIAIYIADKSHDHNWSLSDILKNNHENHELFETYNQFKQEFERHHDFFCSEEFLGNFRLRLNPLLIKHAVKIVSIARELQLHQNLSPGFFLAACLRVADLYRLRSSTVSSWFGVPCELLNRTVEEMLSNPFFQSSVRNIVNFK